MKYFLSIISLLSCVVILVVSIMLVNNHFYPMTYKDEIINLSNKYNIEASLISSIANVESGMKSDAKSNKGALGIMQLMPTTAEWLANKMGVEYSEEKLYEADYNLELGSYYISYLKGLFDNEENVICAYNAGQGNVKTWLTDSRYSQDGKTLKIIPFKETKEYLNKVLKNRHYYQKRYK